MINVPRVGGCSIFGGLVGFVYVRRLGRPGSVMVGEAGECHALEVVRMW
jgi:hypothetical protein